MVTLRGEHVEIFDLEPGDLRLRGWVRVMNQCDTWILGVDLR